MPGRTWGIRSIPFIASRYPLWDQPDLMRQVDEGRWYLPDAEDGLRETLTTSTLEGEPQQCLRVPGSSFVPMLAAVATGGGFRAEERRVGKAGGSSCRYRWSPYTANKKKKDK